MESKKYYLVSLSLEATWSENEFTYHGSSELERGAVVIAPFGKNLKLGFVIKETSKPTHPTKKLKSISIDLLPKTSLELMKWLNEMYPMLPGLHTQNLLPSFVKEIMNTQSKQLLTSSSANLEKLTNDQEKAVKEINSSQGPTILHGITGSGKTRVYQELALSALAENKNVLIIYPEISLTAHISKAFSSLGKDFRMNIYHSKNAKTEQKNTWLNALNSKSANIFIGPRSALFLPISNIGLVIVDEAHDGSLKQDSGTRYNGLLVAAKLASLHGAKLVLGSATPPVQETQQILTKNGNITCMHKLAIESQTHKQFAIVDMTDKSNRSNNSNSISKPLLREIENNLKLKKQTMLFLNRRGTARVVVCSDCGWHAECNSCENNLTYHHDQNKMICHLCGNKQKIDIICPDCNSSLTQKSPGTKALESELNRLFPNAKISRFDSDNRKSESMTENYETIRSGNTDIIIGTQIVTKGLDLPKLASVGIINADSYLFLPDFSSTERSFQQLLQVSGRVGRGHQDGKIFVQTYNKDNKVFKYLTEEDWHGFYSFELSIREKLMFPPYSFIMRIWVNRKSDKSASSAIRKVLDGIDKTGVKVMGPAPSFYPKISGSYCWQITLMSKSRSNLSKIAASLPKQVFYDLDPISLL